MWTSQAAGTTLEKVGIVEKVVAAGEFIRILEHGLYGQRKHESYLVRVDRGPGRQSKLYWPRVAGLRLVSHAAPVPAVGTREGLTFAEFSAANRLRCERDFGRTLGTRDAAVSMCIGLAEESGEVAGAVRAYLGISERKNPSVEAVGNEIADLVSYADLLAQTVGLSLADALVRKFNIVSGRIGSDVRLAAPTGELAADPMDRPGLPWVEQCHCGSGKAPHRFGKHESCESYKHHCDTCHGSRSCTLHECIAAFNSGEPARRDTIEQVARWFDLEATNLHAVAVDMTAERAGLRRATAAVLAGFAAKLRDGSWLRDLAALEKGDATDGK